MKKLILITMLIAEAAFAGTDWSTSKPTTDAEWNVLLTALSIVESNGRTNIRVLDTNGKYSYGCLQIQDLYLLDSGLNYKLEDLYSKEVSFAIAKAYLTRYGRSYERRTGKVATYEVLARIHNGGPRGAEKVATVKYWTKVKAALDK